MAPTSSVYNILIEDRIRNRLEFDDLLDEMKSKGTPLDILTYTLTVQAKAKSKDFVGCKKLMEEMDSCGIRPTVSTYYVLLSELERNYEIGKYIQTIGDMRSKEIMITAEIYRRLALMVAEKMDINHVTLILKNLKSLGFNPDFILFDEIIRRLVSNNKLADSIFIMGEMRSQNIQPTATTYNLLLSCLVANRDYRRFGLLLNEIAANTPPDRQTFAHINQILSHENHTDEYAQLVNNMLEHTFISVDFCNNIMRTMLANNNVAGCWVLLDKMTARGKRPDTYTYHIFSNGLAELKDIGGCIRVLKLARSEDITTFRAAYKCIATLAAKDIRGSIQVLNTARLWGVDKVGLLGSYKAILRQMAIKNDVGGIEQLMEEMRNEGLTPDADTYWAIIEHDFSLQNWHRCKQILDDMVAHNVHSTPKLDKIVKTVNEKLKIDPYF